MSAKVRQRQLAYSDAEQKLLDLIPTNGAKITTEELAAKLAMLHRTEEPLQSQPPSLIVRPGETGTPDREDDEA